MDRKLWGYSIGERLIAVLAQLLRDFAVLAIAACISLPVAGFAPIAVNVLLAFGGLALAFSPITFFVYPRFGTKRSHANSHSKNP